MKTKLNNMLILVQAVAAAAMIGAIKLWAPVCGKMLELVSGKEVPMKCHWAGQAAIAICIIILAAAIMALLAKKEYKGLMVVTAVVMVTHNSRWAEAANRRCRLDEGILIDLEKENAV